MPVPSLISFKAKGLLLPSLPDIVPVRLKEPSVEFLFTVLVAPADTVALNGSLPDKAHDIAQDVESSNGSWVHAYLHRVEGDLGNAAYWYSRAGRPAKRDEDMNEEWKEIAKELVNLNI